MLRPYYAFRQRSLGVSFDTPRGAMDKLPEWLRKELKDGELAIYDPTAGCWKVTMGGPVRYVREHSDPNCNDDDHDECLCFGRCSCHWR